MNNKRFYLSRTDKKIAGVCGGLAEYFNIDPLLVRVLFLMAFFTAERNPGTALIGFFRGWVKAFKKGGDAK